MAVQRETSDLFDETSGQWLGVLGPDGKEQVFNPGGRLSALVATDVRNRALRAWRAQPKTYKLATVPDPTIFIDSTRGLDTNPGTRAQPYQTIGKLLTALPAAGACVALANDSLFDLAGAGVSFSVAGATAVNGTNETTRVTFTNYDPGNAPSQRPRIRNRYLPTAGNWTWDGAVGAWYYTNPNARSWGSYDALVRFSNGAWGNSRSTNLPTLAAGLLTKDYDYYADDTTKRLYLYAPSSTDPTTYYGGAGSVILGETERAALQFSRCGNFVTVDNIIFEDCGMALALANLSASADIAGFVVQNCQFLNCGKGVAFRSDSTSTFTQSGRVLANVFRGMGNHGVHTQFKPTAMDVAGNLFSQVNMSTSHGGALYAQGSSGGVQTMAGNRCFENYVEDAKFNRGNCPFDGAGLYFEVRTKGWDCFKNFITRCHHGICNNTGATLAVRHNVFDDVDLPYMIGDGNAVGTINSTFEHNTAIDCGVTKYRTGDSSIDAARPERDPLRALLGNFDSLSTSSTFNHRNNLIHLAANAPAIAGMEVRRLATYDTSGNHFAGAITNPVQTYQFGVAATVVSSASTSTGSVVVGAAYEPLAGVPAAPALTALPSPLDAYGVASPLPPKGAVSI